MNCIYLLFLAVVGCLDCLSNICAIITAIIAVCFWIVHQRNVYVHQKDLERYLKSEKEKASKKTLKSKEKKDTGQRSVLHLMAELRLTEEQILHASFNSNNIDHKRVPEEGRTLTDKIVLEYVEGCYERSSWMFRILGIRKQMDDSQDKRSGLRQDSI